MRVMTGRERTGGGGGSVGLRARRREVAGEKGEFRGMRFQSVRGRKLKK